MYIVTTETDIEFRRAAAFRSRRRAARWAAGYAAHLAGHGLAVVGDFDLGWIIADVGVDEFGQDHGDLVISVERAQ